MKLSIILLMSLLLSITAYAEQPQNDSTIKIAKEFITQGQGFESTCLDSYMERRSDLVKQTLIVGPASIVVGTAGAAFVGTYVGAALGSVVPVAGTIVGSIVGPAVAGGVALYGFAAKEVINGVNLVKANSLAKGLAEAKFDLVEKKTLSKMLKKFNKKYKKEVELQVFVDSLIALDQSGALCDGSLVLRTPLFYKNRDKLKYKLANKKEILASLNDVL